MPPNYLRLDDFFRPRGWMTPPTGMFRGVTARDGRSVGAVADSDGAAVTTSGSRSRPPRLSSRLRTFAHFSSRSLRRARLGDAMKIDE